MPQSMRRDGYDSLRSTPRFAIGAVLVLLTLGAGLVFPVQGLALELGDLLDAPAKYDGLSVTVTGTAGEPRYRESRRRSFTVFDLSDNHGRSIRVFSWGRLTIQRGEKVEVEGRFLKSKAVGRHAIQNEIEAVAVRHLPEHF